LLTNNLLPKQAALESILHRSSGLGQGSSLDLNQLEQELQDLTADVEDAEVRLKGKYHAIFPALSFPLLMPEGLLRCCGRLGGRDGVKAQSGS
jgi:hypothetical protein